MLFQNSSANDERARVTYQNIEQAQNASKIRWNSSIRFDQFSEEEFSFRFSQKTKYLVFGLCALGIGVLIAVAIVFLPRLFETSSNCSTEKTTTTITTTTSTARTSIVSSTSSMSSTTTQCPTGYLSSPTGVCVDLMNDIRNCGSFGFICSSNHRRCSAGSCTGFVVSPVLTNITSLIWDARSSIDDRVASVTLPLNVTLYNSSSDTILVSSNGVSRTSNSLVSIRFDSIWFFFRSFVYFDVQVRIRTPIYLRVIFLVQLLLFSGRICWSVRDQHKNFFIEFLVSNRIERRRSNFKWQNWALRIVFIIFKLNFSKIFPV